jgi:hypothetical protein
MCTSTSFYVLQGKYIIHAIGFSSPWQFTAVVGPAMKTQQWWLSCKLFYFQIIISSHAIVRSKNREIMCTLFPISWHNILQNYNGHQNQEIGFCRIYQSYQISCHRSTHLCVYLVLYYFVIFVCVVLYLPPKSRYSSFTIRITSVV